MNYMDHFDSFVKVKKKKPTAEEEARQKVGVQRSSKPRDAGAYLLVLTNDVPSLRTLSASHSPHRLLKGVDP